VRGRVAGRHLAGTLGYALRVLRVGVIGYGHWGPNYARLLDAIAGVELTVICDQRADRRREAASRYPRVAIAATVDDLLASSADAVVVATPAETHLAIGLAVLAAGRHVLIEKPMGLDRAEVAALIAAAGASDRVLMVDHTYVFSDGVAEVLSLVGSGALDGQFAYRSVRTNPGRVAGEVGVLRDLAVHDLSILDRLHRELPVSVAVRLRSHEIPGSTLADLSLGYPDGSTAEITAGWGTGERSRLVVLESPVATIVYDDLAIGQKVRLLPQVGEASRCAAAHDEAADRAVDAPCTDREPLRHAIEHFIAAVASGSTPVTDGRSALRMAQILDAGRRSLKADGLVEQLDELGAHG
jgi:predicted dehydrogenase